MSKSHEWINSFGVLAALAVSAYFGWHTDRLKSESVLMDVHPTGACSVTVGAAESALCWSMIITNGSENRLTIVDASWRRVLPSAAEILGFEFVTPNDGQPLSFPVNLDGGEGKKIIVRAVVLLTSDVADVNRAIGESQPQPPKPYSLREVQLRIAAAGLDILGNKVNPVWNGKSVIAWRWDAAFRPEVDLLTLKTGRGGAFSTTLTYPSATDNGSPEG